MRLNQASLVPGSAAPTAFRTIHYLGSKLRLLRTIQSAVTELVPNGGRIYDLFSGSGSVSLGLRHAWAITAVDIQEYSRVLCNAILNPPTHLGKLMASVLDRARRSPLRTALRNALRSVIELEQSALKAASRNMEDLCNLLDHGPLLLAHESDPARRFGNAPLPEKLRQAVSLLEREGLHQGSSTVVTRHFGGIYFSWEQAIDLDVLLDIAHAMDPNVRDTFVAAVLATASDVANTVGKQFAQPIRPRDRTGCPKTHLVRQTQRDRSIEVLPLYYQWLNRLAEIPAPLYAHHAIRGDYVAALRSARGEFELVYADPPYTRDHYSRYYHVLETMALHDEPDVSTTTIRSVGKPVLSRGLYRKDRHQSKFCIKSQAPSAFDALFRAVSESGKPLLMSYSPYKADEGNRPRLLTIAELTNLAEQHFERISVHPVGGVSHNKLNITRRNVPVEYAAEVLMFCR